jgi:putative FmdB family regulatory protein
VPLYDYDCAACGCRFEVIHGVHADPPTSCPLCGSGPVRKAIVAPAVHYKGSGWAKKERRAGVRSGSASSGGEGDTAEVGSGTGSGSAGSGSAGSDSAGSGSAGSGSKGDDAGDHGSAGSNKLSTTSKSSSTAQKAAGADGD